MSRVLLDSNVVLYALGGPHRYAEPCRRILELAGAGRVAPEAPVDLVQEILHHRSRRLGDRRQAVSDARAAAMLCTLHPVDARDAEQAAELFANTKQISARDAIFAAIATRHKLEVILSADTHFDELPQLRRVDPADSAAVDSLAAG